MAASIQNLLTRSGLLASSEAAGQIGKRRRGLWRAYFLVLGLIYMVSTVLAAPAGATTLSVCSSGCDYTTIQGAIDAAGSGDIIEVEPGIYQEALEIDKAVTLLSTEGPDITVIQAASAVVTVVANNVAIEGFTIKLLDSSGNGDFFGIESPAEGPLGADRSGLRVVGNIIVGNGGSGAFGENGVRGRLIDAVIEDNQFSAWASAVYFRPYGVGNVVSGNTISASNTGVLTWSENTLIEENTFSVVNMGVDVAQSSSAGNSTAGTVLRNNALGETTTALRVRGTAGVVDARLNDWGLYTRDLIRTKVKDEGTGNTVLSVPFIDSDGKAEPPLIRRWVPGFCCPPLPPEHRFMSIQEAIDDPGTVPGTKLFVTKGKRTDWLEAVVVDKPGITLCGSTADINPCNIGSSELNRPRVDASGLGGPAFTVTGDDAIIEGFAISGSDPLVRVNGADNATVRMNSLQVQTSATSARQGISYTSASGGTVSDNSIVGNVYPGSIAIRTLNSDGVTITGNTITESRVGIYSASSTNTSISNNAIGLSPNTPGFGADTLGVSLFAGSDHIVTTNSITGMGVGITVGGASDTNLIGGSFNQVPIGVRISGGAGFQPQGTKVQFADLSGATTPLVLTSEVSGVDVDARRNHWGRYTRSEISSSIVNDGTGNTIDIACWLSSDQITENCPPIPIIDSPEEGAVFGTSSLAVTGSGADAGATVEILRSIDSAVLTETTASSDGGWDAALEGLADGAHAIIARGTLEDSNGVLTRSDNSSVRSFAVDLSPPDTTILSGPVGTVSSSAATLSFSSSKEGSTFECALDGAAFSSCTTPVSYSGLLDGDHEFQVRATDEFGHIDPTPAIRNWNVIPDTTISSGPAGTVNSKSASFTFASSISGSTFECSLDGSAFLPCTSPRSYSALADGIHSFEVRATGPNGNIDLTAALRTWTIDFSPDTFITGGPSGQVNTTDASFAFVSSEAVSTFGCSLDGGPFLTCVSPKLYSGLASGSHSFQVRATSDGKTDPSPATRSWTIDVSIPDTTITSGPSGTVSTSNATFAFTSTKSGSVFQCSLDGGAFVSCSSPRTYGGLADGSHTFAVRALDSAGNVDPTPASRTWLIDATGPAVTIMRPINGLYIGDQLVMTGTTTPMVIGSVTVEASALDTETGISNFRFEVSLVPVNPSLVTYDAVQKIYRFTYSPPSPGTRTITARATNASGLSASASVSITGVSAI